LEVLWAYCLKMWVMLTRVLRMIALKRLMV
jgi:hypothetical protein